MDFKSILNVVPLLKKERPLLLGIDIGATTVKLIALSKQGKSLCVDAFAISPLSEGQVVEREIKNPAAVIDAIRRTVKISRTSLTNAAVALADSSVITKIVLMDANIPELELETQIYHEANQHIPYPIQEVSLDFEVIGTSENDPRKIKVALAASRAETINNYVNVIEQAGLKLKIIDVESFVLARACKLLESQIPEINKEIFAIVSIGAERSLFTVCKKYLPIFNRSEALGAKKIFQSDSQEDTNISKDEIIAEQKKFLELLIQCIRRSIQLYNTSSNEEEIQHIILMGGGALIADIASNIEMQTEIPTVVANPLQNMKYGSEVDKEHLIKIAPSMMSCFGLALRSFDEGF